MTLARPVIALTLGLAAGGDPAMLVFVGRGLRAPREASYDLQLPRDLRGFPSQSMFVDLYGDALESHLDGFGLNSGVFFRFDGELDAGSLPEPAESVAADAAVYLVDVDPDSPARGQRVPLMMRFNVEAG